jgi:hypothetical protein
MVARCRSSGAASQQPAALMVSIAASCSLACPASSAVSRCLQIQPLLNAVALCCCSASGSAAGGVRLGSDGVAAGRSCGAGCRQAGHAAVDRRCHQGGLSGLLRAAGPRPAAQRQPRAGRPHRHADHRRHAAVQARLPGQGGQLQPGFTACCVASGLCRTPWLQSCCCTACGIHVCQTHVPMVCNAPQVAAAAWLQHAWEFATRRCHVTTAACRNADC